MKFRYVFENLVNSDGSLVECTLSSFDQLARLNRVNEAAVQAGARFRLPMLHLDRSSLRHEISEILEPPTGDRDE